MNEPVAWMVENDEDISFIMNGKGLAESDNSWKNVTPVYTHPADLTDEEIDELAEYHGIDSLYETGRLDFARAILRKAK